MSAPLPGPSKPANALDMEVEPVLLAEPHASDVESLVSRNDPDFLENEQTWPTDDEMQCGVECVEEIPDAKEGTTPKRVRKVPRGMSTYQAAWIIDDDEDEEDEDKDGFGDSGADLREGEDELLQDVPADAHEIESTSPKDDAFEDLDMEEENNQWVLFSLSLRRFNGMTN